MYEVTRIEGLGRYLTLTVSEEQAGQEVLHLMKDAFLLSTRKIKSVKFCDRGIFLDGQRVTVRRRVQAGQVLQILLDDAETVSDDLLDYPADLRILYEDDDFLFIQKPAGWVCHPSQGHYADSVINAACALLRSRGQVPSLHLLGRLDKETSGIVGFAKNAVMQDRLEWQRDIGLFQKEYLAIAQGYVEADEGDLSTPLKEIPTPEGNHTYMVEAENGEGKSAATHFRVLGRSETYSLCLVHIQTGRTHQIRFHMAHEGHPLLGDALYGGDTSGVMKRAALHAWTVTFRHPVTDEKISFTAEIPEDMKKTLGYD